MSFSSTSLNKIADTGFIRGSMWLYQSSDPSTAVKATGYFAGCGVQGKSSANVGMRPGDILINAESSAGATPGRATLHAVTGSTANVSSTTSSTGFNAGYDCTVSAATT